MIREVKAMSEYSEQDLKYASEFRDDIHREALAKVREVRPGICAVTDPYSVEDYYQKSWEYPGRWYTVVSIPERSESREALIDTIVKHTLAHHGEKPALQEKPCPAENDLIERKTESGIIRDEAFRSLIAEYPDLVIDYCIVKNEDAGVGLGAHRKALARACRELFADENDGAIWRYDVGKADAEKIDVDDLFSQDHPEKGVNYRKAFLYPPHENDYSGKDFVRVNSALFPSGTDGLEVYKWTTDWSEYFDDGHEWWGTLCLTVFDKSLDRFVVILASATD